MLFQNPRHYLVLAWSLVVTIIILSLLPGSSMPKYSWIELFAIDKWGHFMFYGSTAWSFSKYDKLKNFFQSPWFIGISLLLLGILMECLQYLMKQGRSFDLLDILANGIGVFFGLKYFDYALEIVLKKLSKP